MNSWIVAFTGARGSGKTLSAVALAVEHMRLKGMVFSNIKIHYQDKQSYGLELEHLVSLSPDLTNVLVLMDEIQNLADTRRAMTFLNRLVDALAIQSRKRSLILLYTVININWVDVRLRYLTDVVVECRDLATTMWGREEGLEPGKLIGWHIYDLSGRLSGIPGQFVGSRILRGEPYWKCYDTFEVVDFFQQFTKVKIDAPTLVITPQFPQPTGPAPTGIVQGEIETGVEAREEEQSGGGGHLKQLQELLDSLCDEGLKSKNLKPKEIAWIKHFFGRHLEGVSDEH